MVIVDRRRSGGEECELYGVQWRCSSPSGAGGRFSSWREDLTIPSRVTTLKISTRRRRTSATWPKGDPVAFLAVAHGRTSEEKRTAAGEQWVHEKPPLSSLWSGRGTSVWTSLRADSYRPLEEGPKNAVKSWCQGLIQSLMSSSLAQICSARSSNNVMPTLTSVLAICSTATAMPDETWTVHAVLLKRPLSLDFLKYG